MEASDGRCKGEAHHTQRASEWPQRKPSALGFEGITHLSEQTACASSWSEFNHPAGNNLLRFASYSHDADVTGLVIVMDSACLVGLDMCLVEAIIRC